MRFKVKLSFIAFQIILRFKSYHQIIKSKLDIKSKSKSNSNQIKPFNVKTVINDFVIFNLAPIVFFIKKVHTPASCSEIGTLSVKVEMMWLAVGNMIVLSLVFLQQGWGIFIIK